VSGVELHPESAALARERVAAAGGCAAIAEGDFFLAEPSGEYSVVIGNPPFIRYQAFAGVARSRSREAALKAGVSLSALASSWAAFTVHSALFLTRGGRMGLVLPAELLSVNYASAVRRFLFDRFRKIELVLFEEQVFPGVEADVVLLLAEGFDEGPTTSATIHHTRNAESLSRLRRPTKCTPLDPAAKWTSLLDRSGASQHLDALKVSGSFVELEAWGDTTLGIVTGANNYFALSPERKRELRLADADVVPLSPPGSSHLRGLSLSAAALVTLGTEGRSNWLFYPRDSISSAAWRYIEAGHLAGVDQAYKCRVRTPWYRVPLLPPADLLLTCMNADTPRLVTNRAGAHHLNSVHGVYLKPCYRTMGRDLLPLASLNSVTLLSAEIVGRSYGGGILKLEPREADAWAVPSPSLVAAKANSLRALRPKVAKELASGNLLGAVQRVDEVLLDDSITSAKQLDSIRSAHSGLSTRRTVRATRGRRTID